MKFTIEGDAVPQSRPRFTRNGHAYIPERSRQWRQVVRKAAVEAMCGREPMTGEVVLVVDVYRRFKPTARNFGDADNHLKAVADALNGIAFADDSQVVRIVAEKHRDTARPRIEVEICTLGE